MAAADEVLVPTHPTVGCGLPRLAGQAAPVNEDDGITDGADRDLITDVHLIDGDRAVRGTGRRARERVRVNIATADKEAALLIDPKNGRFLCRYGNREQRENGYEQTRHHST